MRVLIYEPNSSGHRFTYVRLLVQALSRMGVVPILATDENAPATEQFHHQIEPVLSQLKLEATLKLRPEAGGVSDPLLLLETMGRLKPDHVYIPYADVLAQHLGMRKLKGKPLWDPNVEVEALLMRGTFAYPGGLKTRLKANFSWKLATRVPWTTLFHLDPLVIAALGARVPRNLQLLPDPVEEVKTLSKEEARTRLNLASQPLYVGCVGGLDVRKGVDLLVRAFCAREPRSDVKLLLAGKMSPEIKALVSNVQVVGHHADSIITLDRYLSNEEMDAALQALDLVCTPYPRHIGSASFVIRAAAVGRPVLGSNFGWLGYVIPQFGLGACCPVEDTLAFAAELDKARLTATSYAPGERAKQFREFHTVQNFEAAWSARLKQRLGLPPAQLPRWEDLLR